MQRFLPLLAALLLGCPPAGGDDDDSARYIPPPSGCNLTALDTVVFRFHIHFGGIEYPQDGLVDLLASGGWTNFLFPFDGAVTELGEDEDTNLLAVTVTQTAAEGDPPPDDPNWLRITYQLPMNYELPASLGQALRAELNLDLTAEDLIKAFALYELSADADPALVFFAEPTELGMAYVPGEFHPLFDSVELRDRACPNLTEQPCASKYNLALEFRTQIDEETGAGGETFELWPTESRDFAIGGPSYRAVNAWSYTHREIQECVNPYDFTAQRKSFFVTRSDFAP